MPHEAAGADSRRLPERREGEGRGLHEGMREAMHSAMQDEPSGERHAGVLLPATFFLLRMVDATGAMEGYIGLAPRRAHVVVPEARQARRFPTIEAALVHAGSTGGSVARFEIEPHLAR